MTEETHNAAMSGSIGIITAIGVSAVLGWFLILGLLFSIQDLDTTIHSPTGQPVTQIFLDTVGPKGAIVLMVIVIGCMYFCGWVASTSSCDLMADSLSRTSVFSITSNSRMMYAFARDGGIPGHRFFHKVDPKTKSPIRTVWLACTLSFILGLPSLGSSVAFAAATRYEMTLLSFHRSLMVPWLHSIATIGLYISYGIPIALRVWNRKSFERGPFHLGKFSYPIATTAVLWICLISIVFILPQANPVNSQSLNYAIVAVGIVVLYSVTFWLVSARKWFKGPIKQIEGKAKSQAVAQALTYHCTSTAEARGIDVTDPANADKIED